MNAKLRKAGRRRAKAEAERHAASQALAEAVREAIEEGGMDKATVAREAGVSRQTVHKLLVQ